MPSAIHIQLDDGRAVARLKRLQAAAANMRPLFETIGAGLLSNVQLGFKKTQSPYGEAWRPLKKRVGKPLRDTGRLLGSMTQKADREGVTVGTGVKYAAIHQFGGKAGRGRKVTIPARPFFPLTADGQTNLPLGWEKSVVTRIKAYFAKAGE